MNDSLPTASAPIIGEGAYRYRFERNWAKLPRWWSFGTSDPSAKWPTTAVKGATAPNGDIYVLSRSAHPICVFDGDGNFISSWGEGMFSWFVHGITFAPDGRVWITDAGTQMITVHEPSGELVKSIGSRNVPSPTWHGRPFNMPTGVAFTSTGEVFASDGYGNRRVHHFDADGKLIKSWGAPGNGPGQFALVHYVTIDSDDRVYIADRENHRVQVFDTAGEYITEVTGFEMPSDLAIGKETIYVTGRDGVSLLTRDHTPILRFASADPAPGTFRAHGIWIDAAENIFLAQTDRVVSKLTRL